MVRARPGLGELGHRGGGHARGRERQDPQEVEHRTGEEDAGRARPSQPGDRKSELCDSSVRFIAEADRDT